MSFFDLRIMITPLVSSNSSNKFTQDVRLTRVFSLNSKLKNQLLTKTDSLLHMCIFCKTKCFRIHRIKIKIIISKFLLTEFNITNYKYMYVVCLFV
jgi:hypothetical protein